MASSYVILGYGFPHTSRRPPGRNFDIMKARRGGHVAKPVGYELVPSKTVLVVDLKVDLGPTLEASSGKVNVHRVTPVGCFPH